MKTSDVAFEMGKLWVGRYKENGKWFWTVYENGITHATSLGVAWDGDENGLSLAIGYTVHRAGGDVCAKTCVKLAEEHYRRKA